MRSFAFTFAFLFSLQSLAVGSAAFVKLYAGLSGAAPTMTGSGLILRTDDSFYVLTSDHVTAKSAAPYSHTGFNPAVGKLKLNWLLSDWARGISILKVEDSKQLQAVEKEIPHLKELNRSVQIPSQVRLIGFPASSLEAVEAQGNLVGSYSDYILFYSVRELLRINDTQAEFGMSGGVMLDDQGLPVGLVSHQTLDPNSISASGIVISYKEIYPLLYAALVESDPTLWNFHENNGSSLNSGSQFIKSGGLQINFSNVQDESFSRISLSLAREKSHSRIHPHFAYAEQTLLWREQNTEIAGDTTNSIRILGWRKKGNFSSWFKLDETSFLAILEMLDQGDYELVGLYSYGEFDDVRARVESLGKRYSDLLVSQGKKTGAVADAARRVASLLISANESETERAFFISLKSSDLRDLLENPFYSADWLLVDSSLREAFIEIEKEFRLITY